MFYDIINHIKTRPRKMARFYFSSSKKAVHQKPFSFITLQSSDCKVSPAGSVTSGSDSSPDCHSTPSVSLRYSQQLRQLFPRNNFAFQSEAKCAPTLVRILIITMGAKHITRRFGTVYTTIGSTYVAHDNLGSHTEEELMTIVTSAKSQAAYTTVTVTDNELKVTTKQLNGYVLDEFSITDKDAVNDGADTSRVLKYVIITASAVALVATGTALVIVIKKKRAKQGN